MADPIDLSSARQRLADLGLHPELPTATHWYLSRRLGFACTHPAASETARWIYQELRARIVRRLPPLGAAPAVGAAQVGRLASRAMLSLEVDANSCPLDPAEVASSPGQLVAVFGRRRTRLLDFDDRSAWSMEIDTGHPAPVSDRELAARSGASSVPTRVLSVKRFIMREELVDGFNLAAGTPRRATALGLLDAVARWQAGFSSVDHAAAQVATDDYLEMIENDLGDRAASVEWRHLREQLALETTGHVSVGPSHGDLQLANAVATPSGIRLVDFESFDRRWIGFDHHDFYMRYGFTRELAEARNEDRLWFAVEDYRRRWVDHGR